MPQRILFVEDDPETREYAQVFLERHGFEFVGAGSAAEARAAFTRERFDIAIIDIGLADSNGMELAKDLDLKSSGVPFIFLTGFSDLRTRLECFELGADDYILKPFAADELVARIKAHLRPRPPRPGD